MQGAGDSYANTLLNAPTGIEIGSHFPCVAAEYRDDDGDVASGHKAADRIIAGSSNVLIFSDVSGQSDQVFVPILSTILALTRKSAFSWR